MVRSIHFLANPSRFMKLTNPVIPIVGFISFIFILLGLWFGLFNSPPDYQQGDTVRIMYIHVPSAWIGLLSYSLISFMSILYIIWKFPLSILIAIECTFIGLVFTLIALITGSIWGNPTWGTWWIWDARLTSFLILVFIYLGLIVLSKSFKGSIRGEKAFAILAIIGAFNLPVIKFSVEWWNTLHQPASVFRADGTTISEEILLPLILMSIGFLALFLVLVLISTKTEILNRKLFHLRNKLKNEKL